MRGRARRTHSTWRILRAASTLGVSCPLWGQTGVWLKSYTLLAKGHTVQAKAPTLLALRPALKTQDANPEDWAKPLGTSQFEKACLGWHRLVFRKFSPSL